MDETLAVVGRQGANVQAQLLTRTSFGRVDETRAFLGAGRARFVQKGPPPYRADSPGRRSGSGSRE